MFQMASDAVFFTPSPAASRALLLLDIAIAESLFAGRRLLVADCWPLGCRGEGEGRGGGARAGWLRVGDNAGGAPTRCTMLWLEGERDGWY